MTNLTKSQLFSFWVEEVKRMKSERGISPDQYSIYKGNECVWVVQGGLSEYWVFDGVNFVQRILE